MTITEPVAGRATTVYTLLFGGSGGADTAAAFERSLVPVATVARGAGRRLGLLSEAGRKLVDSRIAAVAGGLLNLSLDDELRKAWATHRKLREAARETLATPGSEQTVDLVSQRATSTYQPFIEVTVDKTVVRTVRFDLVLVSEVQALLVLVRDGELVAVQTGRCEVTATLSCDGFVLAGPRSTELLIPGMVWLEHPIRLATVPMPSPS